MSTEINRLLGEVIKLKKEADKDYEEFTHHKGAINSLSKFVSDMMEGYDKAKNKDEMLGFALKRGVEFAKYLAYSVLLFKYLDKFEALQKMYAEENPKATEAEIIEMIDKNVNQKGNKE